MKSHIMQRLSDRTDRLQHFKFIMTITDYRVFQITFKVQGESPTPVGNGNFSGGEISFRGGGVMETCSKEE